MWIQAEVSQLNVSQSHEIPLNWFCTSKKNWYATTINMDVTVCLLSVDSKKYFAKMTAH